MSVISVDTPGVDRRQPPLAEGQNGHIGKMTPLAAPRRRRAHLAAGSPVTVALAVLLAAGGAGATLTRTAADRSSTSHVLVGGSVHRSAATVDVVSGTTSVVVTAGAPSGRLYRVHTPAGSGIRPLATLDGGTLRVAQIADRPGHGVPTIDIQLARGVRWTINLDGGASTETVNMQRGALSSLSFGAGVSMASVRLPAPVGTLTLRLAGGASQLLVVAPPGTPAQLDVVGGASEVRFDGVSHTGVAGGSVFSEPAWATAPNRYRIDLTAGVSDFELSRT
jgi:hypothetical protein